MFRLKLIVFAFLLSSISIFSANVTVNIIYDPIGGEVKIQNNSGNFVDLPTYGFSLRSNSGNSFLVNLSKDFPNGTIINLSVFANSGFAINSSSIRQLQNFDSRAWQEYRDINLSSNNTFIFTFENKDQDNDGVPYYLDKCPSFAGKPELMGCPSISDLQSKGFVVYNQVGSCVPNNSILPIQKTIFNNITQTIVCPLSPLTTSIKFFNEIKLLGSNYNGSFDYSNPNPFGVPFSNLITATSYIVNSTNYYSGDYICNDMFNKYVGHCRLSAKIKYTNHSFYDQYRKLEIRQREVGGNNVTYLAPYDQPVKFKDAIVIETQSGDIYFEEQNGTLVNLSIPDTTITMGFSKQFDEVAKNISQKDIALSLSEIAYFKTAKDAKDKITQTISTMTSMNFRQDILNSVSKNHLTGKRKVTNSKITINISNIPETKKRLSVYYILPKEVASSTNDIDFSKMRYSTNGKFFVTDKDPIIGWYFENPSDEEIIVIEVPEDTDGGDIIVSEDPVLYNGGNLIVRYRENSCDDGEKLLFELDNLSNSKVYVPESNKNFKVCLAHLIEDLSDGGSNSIELFNILATGNVSTSLNGPYTVFASDDSGRYWSSRIQRENPGSYSCIGSFDNLENSLFGDCDYSPENRLWINLDSDSEPPEINVLYPNLANAIQAEIDINDYGSGVNWATARYCIDSEGSCVPTTGYSQGQKLFISCSGLNGCIKYLQVQVSDLLGNTAVHSEQLRLLDKGSSCQADCTGKPSPNRYLAECSGLNGCYYYQYDLFGLFDEGAYVASQCDFNVIDAWVSFNSTHDIQCPRGPFRESRYTQEDVTIESFECKNLRTTEYPILLNGENIIMNIVSCII